MSIDNRMTDNHDKLYDKKITEYVDFVKFFVKTRLWELAL